MKKIIIAIVCLLAVLSANAQSGPFKWVKAIGASGSDKGQAIVVDKSGNQFIVGNFQGTVDVDPGAGIVNLTSAGDYGDMFILKLNANGDFDWAKNIGGNDEIKGLALTLDTSGFIYITGFFNATVDFDPAITGVYNLTSAGGTDIFILKLDAQGNFVWAKQIGGRSQDDAYAIAIDQLGNIYATGTFAETVDFDPDVAIFNLQADVWGDIYVVKLTDAGNFVWAKRMGGDLPDRALSIALDNQNNVYCTGEFRAVADFDPGPDTANLTIANKPTTESVFISKLDANGNYLWAKAIDGPLYSGGRSVAVDAFGDVYITGGFKGTADFDPGAGTVNLTATNSSYYDLFVLKLNATGNFVWAKNCGGDLYISPSVVCLDGSGYVYTVGGFAGTVDFDPGIGTANITADGPDEVFILKLDSIGNYASAHHIGSSAVFAFGGAVDHSGNVYTTGGFLATSDFDPGSGEVIIKSAGIDDVFIHKMNTTIPANVKEQAGATTTKIYPNPVNDWFTIVASKSSSSNIFIYNSLGELVYSGLISKEINNIEFSNYAEGIYVIKVISTDGGISTQKIIKQ